jgi:Kef-type K+ transport system membrane component KefB
MTANYAGPIKDLAPAYRRLIHWIVTVLALYLVWLVLLMIVRIPWRASLVLCVITTSISLKLASAADRERQLMTDDGRAPSA